MHSKNELIKKIKENTFEHSSIPFWSWNDKLEPHILAEQIEDMEKLGMRGFFMHARAGLETEYMSDDWFDAIRFCVKEAKRRNMEAWAYDENGWPSGFAGGELLKDEKNRVRGLSVEITNEYPRSQEDILGVYVEDSGNIKLAEGDTSGNFYVIRRTGDFSYVDTMNPAVAKQYLSLTHERYKAELGDDFGKAMPGFFTDEPQYFRYGVPWSDSFKETFEPAFGYDPIPKLPMLFFEFDGYEEFRYDYYLHCHRSFYSGFMKPLYDWCEKNGVKLTGHAIEEWGLASQMMCCGGVMPFYLYQHIPGIDYLRRNVRDISGAKQLGSVCEQAGKTTRLTETFASCGWDVTPKELKRIAELQFAGGVNLLCEHLYAYSERGQRKRDYPCHFSEHNSWHKYFGGFETHFKNLGSALAQGNELADTLVIHPIRSAYLRYCRTDEKGIAPLEAAYSSFVKKLSEDHILYHFGDEGIMEELGSVEGASIRIGRCIYDKVILPCCETLSLNTVKLLSEYLKNGGKLYIHGAAPIRIDGRIQDLSCIYSSITYEELYRENRISIKTDGDPVQLRVQLRQTPHGQLMFVANTSEKHYKDIELTVKGVTGLEGIDISTLEGYALTGRKNSDGSTTVIFDLDDSESCLFLESDNAILSVTEPCERRYISVSSPLKLSTFPENMLTLDAAFLSKDGGEYSEMRPIMRIKDELLSERYEGQLTLGFPFDVKDIPKKLIAVAEPLGYTSLRINGHEVSLTNEYRIDRRFLSADITKYTIVGKNLLEFEFDYSQSEKVYEVLFGGGHEALRNCLSFDCEIEAVYLFGDFGVECEDGYCDLGQAYRPCGGFALTVRSEYIELCDIVSDGYPFFAGEMTVDILLNYKMGDPTCLRLNGRFAVSEVSVNGKSLGSRLFENEYELSEYLSEGENCITLTVCFSNRNLLGPHHQKDAEPHSSSPRIFAFEKKWKNGVCEDYIDAPALIKFGCEIR